MNTHEQGSNYIARPKSGTGPGVLVLHAWWGLTPFFTGICDRLAAEGFVALAPDLYHGQIANTIDEAKAASSALPMAETAQQVGSAAASLRALAGDDQAPISVMGFSMGSTWALWLSSLPTSRVAAVIAFYGARAGDYAQSSSAYQFHLAESDPFLPVSSAEKIKANLTAAGKEVEFFTYPATSHWFFESDRPTAYQAEAAELAWTRSLAFLRAHAA